MTEIQWILFAVIYVLIFNRASELGAIVLFTAYSFYALFVIDLDAVYYYSVTALINLCSGLALHANNKYTAICSYFLVVINLLGFWLWYQYLPPALYDNICLAILFIQVITIIPKGLLNGLRDYCKHTLANITIFNRNKARVTIHKSKAQKVN